jgi:predicted outer membrane repeat protein
MGRLIFSVGIALLLVIGLLIWLDPDPIQAEVLLVQGPERQRNSEGDEWVVIASQPAELTPPAPDVAVQDENEAQSLVQPAAVLPDPEAALGVDLDLARQSGPEAVLAFVASQPDPNLPLLRAAVEDAQNELIELSAFALAAPQAGEWVALNSGTCNYSSIQTAINDAVSGDTLLAASGTYVESFDVNGGKQLTIVGGYDASCTSPTPSGVTEIQGSVAGSVADVSGGSNLTLRNLELTGGTSFGAGVDVLGSSKVILDNTDVHDNAGASGGGMYIGSGSMVTITNDADIYANSATAGGGAIVYGSLFGYLTNSDIYGNNSTTDGGGIYIGGGTVILDNADVLANTATEEGGGIYINNGILKLSNSTFVGETAPCCQSAVNGGGIYASGSQVFMADNPTAVMNNTATGNGGGLYLVNGTTLTVTGGQVGHTSFSSGGNDAVLGAGMYVDGSRVIFKGKIQNNIATNSGGGIYATNSMLTMTQSMVGGLGHHEPNQIGATGLNGAGMYLINNTHAWLDQTNIFSNTMTNAATGYGGGIYIRQSSFLTMTNSRVEAHKLPSAFDGRGAGLYVYDATVTLSSTVVATNTAANFAGGVRMFGTSVLNVVDGSIFSNNQALGGNGGGIAATNVPDINVKDSIFQNNHAIGSGGAIYMDAGALSFEGSWAVVDNEASNHGGAVAFLGTSSASFRSTNGPTTSLISNNHAGGNGGAIYLGNASNVSLHATSGYLLAIESNTAGLDGGAAYAGGGGFFDVYGKVSASDNSALGNGGAFYLSGGSRLWIDDYFNNLPSVNGNSAANGGAIYALNSPRVECDGVQFGSSGNGSTATSGSGGAIYLNTSAFSAENCVFQGNQALGGNGGAIAAITSTVNVVATYPLTATVTQQPGFLDRNTPDAPLATACNPGTRNCSRMVLNTASGDGGAIYSSNSNVTLRQTILDQNTAQRGGAIYQESASAGSEIANVLAVKNTSILLSGAGIHAAGGTIVIRDSTLAHNIGGSGFSAGASSSNVYNTIIWGNTVASFTPLAVAECNIDQGGTAGPANNPLFLSPASGDFRPRPGSPAINACAIGLETDLLGAPRPIGAKYDIGAYEVLFSPFLPLMLR